MTEQWWYAGRRAGLEIEDARGWRYRFSAGEVTELQPGLAPRVVFSPGSVSRVCVVGSDQVPARARLVRGIPLFTDEVVMVRGDGEALAVAVRDLNDGDQTTASGLRAAARLSAVTSALGVPVEAADDDDAATLRSTNITTGQAHRRLLRLRLWHYIVMALATLGVVTAVAVGPYEGLYLPALALFVVSAVLDTAMRLELRRRLRRILTTPDLEGRTGISSMVSSPAWKRDASLQIGENDIVVSIGHEEQWIPGPQRGGATACSFSPHGMTFVDRTGAALMAVPDGVWDAADVRAACAAVGVATNNIPISGEAAGLTGALVALEDTGPLASMTMTQRGELSALSVVATPVACLFVAVLVLAAPDRDPGMPETILALVALACALVHGGLSVDRRLWARHLR